MSAVVSKAALIAISSFPAVSGPCTAVPVRLPPGRAREATSPVSTGAQPYTMTIGMADPRPPRLETLSR